MRPSPLVKFGVDISRLERNTRRSVTIVHLIFANRNETFIITSTYEGNHSAGSLHYANQAYDIRPPTRQPGKVLALIRAELGPDFDVVVEPDHWHIEYDPKGLKRSCNTPNFQP